MLLTLSNLRSLRTTIVPALISHFETSFAITLTEESKTITDVLSQIDSRLFQSYTRPHADTLSQLVSTGISSASWVPSTPRPTNVRPYIYDCLLLLVHIHTEVSSTAEPLTTPILSHLLEQLSSSFLEAFKLRKTYTLPALMQATLDVEFVAQTLSQYTTEKVSETQSMIYVELDRGTDNKARLSLQGELGEMRATLKRLREGTRAEFGCFKRDKKPAAAKAEGLGLGVGK
jgi:exocyst complex component 2